MRTEEDRHDAVAILKRRLQSEVEDLRRSQVDGAARLRAAEGSTAAWRRRGMALEEEFHEAFEFGGAARLRAVNSSAALGAPRGPTPLRSRWTDILEPGGPPLLVHPLSQGGGLDATADAAAAAENSCVQGAGDVWEFEVRAQSPDPCATEFGEMCTHSESRGGTCLPWATEVDELCARKAPTLALQRMQNPCKKQLAEIQQLHACPPQAMASLGEFWHVEDTCAKQLAKIGHLLGTQQQEAEVASSHLKRMRVSREIEKLRANKTTMVPGHELRPVPDTCDKQLAEIAELRAAQRWAVSLSSSEFQCAQDTCMKQTAEIDNFPVDGSTHELLRARQTCEEQAVEIERLRAAQQRDELLLCELRSARGTCKTRPVEIVALPTQSDNPRFAREFQQMRQLCEEQAVEIEQLGAIEGRTQCELRSEQVISEERAAEIDRLRVCQQRAGCILGEHTRAWDTCAIQGESARDMLQRLYSPLRNSHSGQGSSAHSLEEKMGKKCAADVEVLEEEPRATDDSWLTAREAATTLGDAFARAQVACARHAAMVEVRDKFRVARMSSFSAKWPPKWAERRLPTLPAARLRQSRLIFNAWATYARSEKRLQQQSLVGQLTAQRKSKHGQVDCAVAEPSRHKMPSTTSHLERVRSHSSERSLTSNSLGRSGRSSTAAPHQLDQGQKAHAVPARIGDGFLHTQQVVGSCVPSLAPADERAISSGEFAANASSHAFFRSVTSASNGSLCAPQHRSAQCTTPSQPTAALDDRLSATDRSSSVSHPISVGTLANITVSTRLVTPQERDSSRARAASTPRRRWTTSSDGSVAAVAGLGSLRWCPVWEPQQVVIRSVGRQSHAASATPRRVACAPPHIMYSSAARLRNGSASPSPSLMVSQSRSEGPPRSWSRDNVSRVVVTQRPWASLVARVLV